MRHLAGLAPGDGWEGLNLIAVPITMGWAPIGAAWIAIGLLRRSAVAWAELMVLRGRRRPRGSAVDPAGAILPWTHGHLLIICGVVVLVLALVVRLRAARRVRVGD